MRPDVLDNLGLFAALKWQAEQFQKHTGIECRIACAYDHGCVDCSSCEYTLDKAVSINLFRIFQESLSNVSRHSGASRVESEYRPENEQLFLSISDNGCGLQEGHVTAPSSFGMRGMRERVGQLEGEISFDTPPGGGMRVTVRVPMSANAKARV
jgi:signal transduction histidine kinase